MKLSELIYEEEYVSETPIEKDIEINDLTRKAEEIGENTLFFLLKSIKNCPENILNIIKRATVIVSDCVLSDENLNTCVLYVKNIRKTMAYAYSRFYKVDYKKTKFIAVTGTNGKTTTATLIKSILEKEGEKVGFIGTGKIEADGKILNEEFYSMTTPDPELLYQKIAEMQKLDCKYIVMEASSHALYFDKLAPIFFEIGIFTNLSPEHLDFHNTLESYYESKLKLFSKCKIGIFNRDDRYSRKALTEVKCKTESVGILWPADAVAREIAQSGFLLTEYIYKEKDLIFKVTMNLVGAYNIYNSLMAIKALIALGFKPCRIKDSLSKVRSIDGRFDVTDGTVTVIRDYAHTPDALDNLLKTVKSVKKSKQNIIIVFGCGGERDKQKRPTMASIAEKYCNLSIITNDNPRQEPENEIIEDILKGFSETGKRIVVTDRKKAIDCAILNAKDGDIIVIAGKGSENYILDKNGYRRFSEKEIIEQALQKRERRDVTDENSFGHASSVKSFD